MALPSNEKKRRRIARYIEKIIEAIVDGNENTEDRKLLDLAKTPRRVARMYVDELFTYGGPPPMHQTRVAEKTADIVAEGPIGFSSFCAHHMLPFTGHAWIAYLANEKIIGLSKIPRIVHYYSRRLQIQERMTQQILQHLCHVLDPQAALVVLKAEHGCMSCRGVSQPDVRTVTASLEPTDCDVGLRDELYRAIERCGHR